jgi:NAD(P)H dehydrogenase (quinone)
VDFAEAAAAVLTSDGHDGAHYELAGPGITLSELAAVVTKVSGTEVGYSDVGVAELVAILTGAGLDEATAAFVAGLDEGIARGELDSDGAELARLLGRPATPVAETVRAAVVSA